MWAMDEKPRLGVTPTIPTRISLPILHLPVVSARFPRAASLAPAIVLPPLPAPSAPSRAPASSHRTVPDRAHTDPDRPAASRVLPLLPPARQCGGAVSRARACP